MALRFLTRSVLAGAMFAGFLHAGIIETVSDPTEPVPWYVTSDGLGTHATSPGTAVFGLDHDGVGDVIVQFGSDFYRGTGTLLPGGNYVLTAAHVVLEDGDVPDAGKVTFETDSGDVEREVAAYHVHPSYSGNVSEGYDLAILELASTAASSIPRYDIYRGDGDVELGTEQVKVGYGQSGYGEDGATTSSGTKRAGLNSYDMDGREVLSNEGGGSNPFGASLPPSGSTSAYDFDSGAAENDVFLVRYGEPAHLGFGDDEVGSAPGDSGGPTFLEANDTRLSLPTGPVDLGEYLVGSVPQQNLSLTREGNNATSYQITYSGDAADADNAGSFSGGVQDFKITGVTSYGFGFTGLPDVDPGTNSSWGEIAVDMRVPYYQSWLNTYIDAAYQPLDTQLVPLTIDDSTAGAKSASVAIDNLAGTAEFSDSGSNDPDDFITYTATVLDHSEGSFSSSADLDTLILDFGTVLLGAAAGDLSFSLYNLEDTASYTADLDLIGIAGSGDTGVLTTDISSFSGLAAGGGNSFLASFTTGAVGSFSATYELSVEDESLPGGTAGAPLYLDLLGVVVVPEPSALALCMLLAVASLPMHRRRR